MRPDQFLIPPGASFWSRAVRALRTAHPHDWQAVRIIVPGTFHVRQMKLALAADVQGAFIAPRIQTLADWLGLQPPPQKAARAASQRLMALYAELRQHAWLKNLFSAESNTDLLPLAQLLLTLSDELTAALLPAIGSAPESARQRWQAALEQLAPPARALLSSEAQLVWSIWQSQLDADALSEHPIAARYGQMMELAARASEALVWIDARAPEVIEQAFLQAYRRQQAVTTILLDWRASALAPVYVQAWPELADEALPVGASGVAPTSPAAPKGEPTCAEGSAVPPGLSLRTADSLEDEALQGAQTIIDWLQAGKSCIAIIAQDRIVARRMRALLERAQVLVTDETGWKLSTTRAAAALAAWFEVVATQADTRALLDLLKSPFVFSRVEEKAQWVMAIEAELSKKNVLGGWDALHAALMAAPAEQGWLRRIAGQATLFSGRKSLPQWVATTQAALEALDLATALAADAAGRQIISMLALLEADCAAMPAFFSFAEWRVLVAMQMETITFVAPATDRRVVMLPLNGARLRSFDAVLVVGCDAAHLPSQPQETLFFANPVRRELGLATRESWQRQQLRDLTEILCTNAEVVLSWQRQKAGEPNPASAWITRLQLVLEQNQRPPLTRAKDGIASATLPWRQVRIACKSLQPVPQSRPAPAAPQLLPATLSASGYNSFVACPYQFFAGRLLRLAGLDALSEMPEKRDYGGWLHEILNNYHESIRENCAQERDALLRQISARIFARELDKNPAALGYYARWQKVIPAYLEWATAREQQGWQFVAGEQWLEKNLPYSEDEITLQGRVDRFDENAAGERAVLDYKTSNQAALNARLRAGEDHQLMFYGLLSARPVSAASFVALELTRDSSGEKIGEAAVPHYGAWQQALEQHIVQNLRAIRQGAPLPANGVESACQYCEVRGLCRKGAW